jgi:hypothetical protein
MQDAAKASVSVKGSDAESIDVSMNFVLCQQRAS